MKFADFALPSEGVLELDFASSVKMPKGAVRMPSDMLEKICLAVRNSRATWVHAVNAFRSIADRFSMSALHIRQVIGTLVALAEAGERKEEARRATLRKPGARNEMTTSVAVETLLACFGRCFEPSVLASNALIYDVKLFTPKECSELRTRLGPVLVFDWACCHDAGSNLPGGNNYELDLSVNDERLVAKYLLSVASRETFLDESGVTNWCLANPEWTEGTLADTPTGISQWVPTWLEEFPVAGIFKVTYAQAAGEEVDISSPWNARREVTQQLLGFDPPPARK